MVKEFVEAGVELGLNRRPHRVAGSGASGDVGPALAEVALEQESAHVPDGKIGGGTIEERLELGVFGCVLSEGA